jgi:signal transduction histidine kinase
LNTFLQQNSQLSQIILDLIRVEINIINKDYDILWMNHQKRIKNPHLKEGMKCYHAFNFKSPCRFCLASQAMEINSVIKNPVCLTDKDKNQQHLNIILSPNFSQEGELQGFIEIIDNVETLYQANTRLEYLNKEYENVIYALSHDLRSPLVSIEGFLRKIKKGHFNSDDKVAVHCLERIHANVETMNNLVTVLLDTSRIARGELDIQNVNMDELIHSIIEQFKPFATKIKAQFTILGPFGMLCCDRIRMKQVFTNIISNVFKHNQNVPDLIIEIGYEDGIYWVKDNGTGIPVEFQDKIFKPFTQGERVGKDSFGMGMNIVYNIIQKHSGRVWLESKKNFGTCIYFTIGKYLKRKSR